MVNLKRNYNNHKKRNLVFVLSIFHCSHLLKLDIDMLAAQQKNKEKKKDLDMLDGPHEKEWRRKYQSLDLDMNDGLDKKKEKKKKYKETNQPSHGPKWANWGH